MIFAGSHRLRSDLIEKALLVWINVLVHEGLQAALQSPSLCRYIRISLGTLYLPVKAGARFSRKCATPSLKSSLLKLASYFALGASNASQSVWNIAS